MYAAATVVMSGLACRRGYCGRGLTTIDIDGDGLLDLVACEQFYSSKVKVGPALYRN